ncbi:MAG: hypothetical protein K2Y42_06690 [Hyphomicrobium sp.]|uniref:replication protein RepA n=1 Tax=Hyphomicrobium sp. TaxID=82 RepID=UPI0025C619A8|nr:replication protein RepA [Hyphomicrobium sp.]MBX9862425.1 hypothetical protein [Hyphomicrobium sp.]
MTSQQPQLIETEVRDPDLLARITGSGFLRDTVYRQCVTEQAKRDALVAMPPIQRRRAKISHAIAEAAAPSRDSLRHIHSVLAICSLPYNKLPDNKRQWESQQGRMKLSVSAGRLMGPDGNWVDQPVPYGTRARMMMMHVCSEAIRTNSATVHVEDTLCGFIRALGYSPTGGKNGTITSFKQQINALAACNMQIGWQDGRLGKTLNTSPFASMSAEMFNDEPNQRTLWPTELKLSHEFYTSLSKHALPVSTHAMRAFSNSPRKIDLMWWLGYRIYTAKEDIHLSWENLKDQWGAGYSRFNNFKRDLALEIADIKDVFPKLPVFLSENGCVIHPGSSEVLAVPHK